MSKAPTYLTAVSTIVLWSIGSAGAHPRASHPQVPLPAVATPQQTTAPYNIMVDAHPTHALNRFSPDAAFGVGVDGVPFHAVPEIYTPSNVRKMLGSGFGAVSYRLYTELSVQDWHWNPAGAYSEGHGRGYWTSSAKPGKAIVDTFGYRLPRRGYTHDEGNDDDHSRLDDGDVATFWKSNPYLARRFTGDPDTAHPQWVLYDMGGAKNVNAARIWWHTPYAVKYAVQYWTGDDPIWDAGHGKWVTFPHGAVASGKGGTVTLALGNAGRKTRYLRIVMTQSSEFMHNGGKLRSPRLRGLCDPRSRLRHHGARPLQRRGGTPSRSKADNHIFLIGRSVAQR